jgi:hypothetical protein
VKLISFLNHFNQTAMQKLFLLIYLALFAFSTKAQIANTWTQKANFGGVGRANAAAFSIGTKGYIGTGNGFSSYKDFWEYDPATNTWSQKATFAGSAQSSTVSFSIGSKGYVGLGFNATNNTQTNEFWEYDPATNAWTQKANFGGTLRSRAVGFSIDTKGYIGLGQEVECNRFKNDFWEYNPSTNAWTQKANFGGTARIFSTGFGIGSKGYIGTGTDISSSDRDDFWEYNPANNIWTQKTTFPGGARNNATSFSIGNKGYLGLGTLSSDFWEYDPSTNVWTQKANYGGGRRTSAKGFSIGTKGYIGTGFDNTGAYKNDFWEFSSQTSNSISSSTISPLSYCQNGTVSIPFTATGTFIAGNIFTAQLSDASGSFASPTNIGSLTATASDTISAIIPAAQAAGAGYRIRVISSSPAVTGSDNGSNITIKSQIADPLASASPSSLTLGQSATLSVTNASPNATYLWNGPGVSNQAGISISVTPSTTGTHTYTVTAQANSGYCNATNNGSVSVTVSGPVTYNWTGTVSTNWYTAGNWSGGSVPTATSDVTIPATGGAYPLISSGTALANDLTIASGATLTISGGTLDVNEDFINNGTFSATSATVIFSGTAAQVIGGSNPVTFHDLTISSAGASLSNSASVQHLLTLNGNLATNGRSFTLLSDATGTAMVVNSGGVVNGTATVQRYINPSLNSGAGYRHFSSPVTSTTINDLATSGFTPVVNSAYNTAANPSIVKPFPTVFQYNQARLTNDSAATMDFTVGWESPSALSSALTRGKGYTVNIPASRTVDFTGTLNNGTVTVTNLNRGATTNSGWHLLGNPYPSPIDWDNISRPSGMMNAVYTFRTSSAYNGSYASYVNGVGSLSGGIIPAMQGFFVRTTSNVASFSFTNAARLTSYNNPSFYRTSETRPLLQLSAKNGQHSDDTYLYQQQGATAGVDNAYDAFSLPMGQVRIYTMAGSEAFAINGLDLNTQQVPLVVTGPAGNYTLKAEQLLNQFQVVLEDKLLNTIQPLTAASTYSFSHSGSTSGNRFLLHLNGSQNAMVKEEKGLELKLFPNPSQGQFRLQLTGIETDEALLTITDITGKVMQQQEVKATNGSISETVDLKAAKGIYLLQVKADSQIIIRKVVVE